MNEEKTIVVRFETKEDFEEFIKKSGLPLTTKTKTFNFSEYKPLVNDI